MVNIANNLVCRPQLWNIMYMTESTGRSNILDGLIYSSSEFHLVKILVWMFVLGKFGLILFLWGRGWVICVSEWNIEQLTLRVFINLTIIWMSVWVHVKVSKTWKCYLLWHLLPAIPWCNTIILIPKCWAWHHLCTMQPTLFFFLFPFSQTAGQLQMVLHIAGLKVGPKRKDIIW